MSRSRLRPTASRRQFLRMGGAVATAGFLAACGADPEPPAVRPLATEGSAAPAPLARAIPAIVPSPTPASAPRLSVADGDRRQLNRLALPGTPWETPVYINRSGEPGPRTMILGGVHGNEPGGWQAAGEIADWMPDRGLTVVIPRANIVATRVIERTLPELGDLNRFYPGVPLETANGFPMQWMAYSIIQLAREFEVSLLLDLHESWGFFNERTQNGTAFLGQTITNGADVAESERIEAIVNEVNEQVSDREQLVMRDRNRNRFSGGATQRPTSDPSWPTGGTSSLGVGQFVPGLVPVLIEMGQQGQSESRRAELHQLFARTALQHEGLLTA
ncbi:MAG: succinylglutamate desuccinylase/aspartoacylase family protein [Chloroflexi bacterium]|nr:succinylglutamate desuccinylase/aspartoacylase family protein [Chloroflexota bacterium]MDA1147639.1 succinylglutamate desuccinylase/aspartoacylase family protein [Chloroflexota bacterium]